MAGYPLSAPWLLFSILMYGFVGCCWLPVVWMQIRMQHLTETAAYTVRRGRGTCSSKHRFLAALAHECGQGCVASSSAIMSISTQAPNGSCATLTALREWRPRSPNT